MITVSAASRLRADLPRLAAGRSLVIDYFASDRCGVVVGDITAGFESAPTPRTHVKIAELQGVPVFAESELVPLLEQTALVVDLGRLPFRHGLVVRLDRPERWLDSLERPGVARRAAHRFEGR
jgi:hypothetical protein